ncbi:DNA topoisomerase III [Rheinheimera sp. SA_1]|uniref:DNA topoisomerase III n=1 Tax=Rheinheimera sp. SA_1 TaxID=1827365 RepID=UPI0007FDD66E|nr:DNA topoisomerase III [Rheinheimera sp. SA_1]OBP14529.1 DNA topoisomerase III [Rheinheimera sp. SA_1]
MILYIAEKPRLGRAIAAVLPQPQRKADGCIYLANGDVVSWCIGHLLEQAEPESYDPVFKRWQLQHLPIIPATWKLQARASSKAQLGILKKLIQQADQLVHAGDPDREGQLLVDEVIHWCGVKGAKLAATQRLLISDLNPSAVRRALQQLKSNQDFVPLSTSALARSRADWLYGLNMTRAYTLQGQKAGYQGVLSVGRVQTPLLGLVARRDLTIQNFVSKPFYQVLAHLLLTENADPASSFSAKWQPSPACEPYQDEEGRVLNQALAHKVAHSITGQSAEVVKLEQKNKQQFAPLPYNLSSLQIDAAKRFGLSAQQVLDIAQQLYERHQLITYPRSDSRHLPKEQLQAVPTVSKAVAVHNEELAAMVAGADFSRKSKAWDDSQVQAHHAIIPTEKAQAANRLSLGEQQIYQLIARQYLLQFYPPYCYAETLLEVRISGGLFRTIARTEQAKGWKQWLGARQKSHANSNAHSSAKSDNDRDDEDTAALLPPLTLGQQLYCQRGEVLEKHTQPPEHFTDATLLAAMTGISRYVDDPEIKKILRDTDGLGTEATRAGIIELLFKRGFLRRDGKHILATATGHSLIAALPDIATKPDMTAQWEAMLNQISQRQQSYQQFMQPLTANLQQLIVNAQQSLPSGLAQQAAPAHRFKRKKAGATRRPKAKV